MTLAYYQASWGGIRLWISSLRYQAGRDLVSHAPSSGDLRVVQDRGRAEQRATMTLLFADFPGESSSGIERLRALQALAAEPKPRIFTHPVNGSYLAALGPLDVDLDSGGPPVVTCELIPAEEIAAVTAIGGGISDAVGTSGIVAAADDLDAELADLWLSNVPADARAAADAWDEGASAREVLVAVERITAQISVEIEAHAMDGDLALWPALKAYVLLGDALRAAAVATSGQDAQTISVLVADVTSLRALLASVYGASEVEARYAAALDLNDIRSPGRIPSGTTITLPAPPARQRSA